MWTVGVMSNHEKSLVENAAIAKTIIKNMPKLDSLITDQLGKEIGVECGIGLAHGFMDVGILGLKGLRIQHTVIGPIVNLASRLCALANPSEILIGGMINEASRTELSLSKVKKLSVKGFPHKMQVYKVT